MVESKFGECSCGGSLHPFWFIETEYSKSGASTGRQRDAVSHLVCARCTRNICVDDSFDGDWVPKPRYSK